MESLEVLLIKSSRLVAWCCIRLNPSHSINEFYHSATDISKEFLLPRKRGKMLVDYSTSRAFMKDSSKKKDRRWMRRGSLPLLNRYSRECDESSEGSSGEIFEDDQSNTFTDPLYEGGKVQFCLKLKKKRISKSYLNADYNGCIPQFKSKMKRRSSI